MFKDTFTTHLETDVTSFAPKNPIVLQSTFPSVRSHSSSHTGFPPMKTLPEVQFPPVKQILSLQKQVDTSLQTLPDA